MTEFGVLEDRGVETASHAGHCPINLVTKLYTKYMRSRIRVVKIGQNVR